MAREAPLYDLVLMLSADAEDDQRAKILADVESAISRAGGSVERNDQWGRRPMAYEIRHQTEADYHLLQFRAPATLIEELSHTLRITDGVVRVRVIKVRRGTPDAPSSPPPVVVAAAATAGQAAAATAGQAATATAVQAAAATAGQAATATAGHPGSSESSGEAAAES